jgi:hypothetical protein
MAEFQKFSEVFKVTSTPTLVIWNTKTSKEKTLNGSEHIISVTVMKW